MDLPAAPHGTDEQALALRGFGVNREEPACVSAPAGRRPRDFATPPTKNTLLTMLCEAGKRLLDLPPRGSKSDGSYLSQSIASDKNGAKIRNIFGING